MVMRRYLSRATQVAFLVGVLIAACTVPERTIQIDQEPGVGSMLRCAAAALIRAHPVSSRIAGQLARRAPGTRRASALPTACQKCKTVNTACLDNCGINFPGGDKWNALIGCSVQACSADCSSSGGTPARWDRHGRHGGGFRRE